MTTQAEKTAIIAAIQNSLDDANAIVVEPDVNPLQAPLDTALKLAADRATKIAQAQAALA